MEAPINLNDRIYKKYSTLLSLILYYLFGIYYDINLPTAYTYNIGGMLVCAFVAVIAENISIKNVLKNLLFHFIAFIIGASVFNLITFIENPKYKLEYFFEFGYLFYIAYILILYLLFSIFYFFGQKIKADFLKGKIQGK